MLNHTTNQHPEPPPIKEDKPLFKVDKSLDDLQVKEIDKQNEELPILVSKSPRKSTMKATIKKKFKAVTEVPKPKKVIVAPP